MQEARDSALSIVKGHRVSELMSIGEEIYDEYMAERIWPGTRALAQAHLDAGQKVWLVTAAPVEIATVIARRLGLTGALGHGRRVGRRRLHRQAGRRTAARPREGGGGTRPGRRGGPGPLPLRRLQRLPQRHPHALPGRPPLRHQPGRQAPQARPQPRMAPARLPHGPQGSEGRHPRGGRRRRGSRRHGSRNRPAPPPPLKLPVHRPQTQPQHPPPHRIRTTPPQTRDQSPIQLPCHPQPSPRGHPHPAPGSPRRARERSPRRRAEQPPASGDARQGRATRGSGPGAAPGGPGRSSVAGRVLSPSGV